MTRARSTAAHDCHVLLERLSAYLDQDLPASQCRVIARHAEACPRCARMLADLRRTAGVCQRASATPLPAAVRRRAAARVKAMLAGRRAPRATPRKGRMDA